MTASATRDDWLAAVAKALKVDPDVALDRLRSTTYDGITIEPLYTAADAPEPRRRRRRSAGGGWDVRQRVDAAAGAGRRRRASSSAARRRSCSTSPAWQTIDADGVACGTRRRPARPRPRRPARRGTLARGRRRVRPDLPVGPTRRRSDRRGRRARRGRRRSSTTSSTPSPSGSALGADRPACASSPSTAPASTTPVPPTPSSSAARSPPASTTSGPSTSAASNPTTVLRRSELRLAATADQFATIATFRAVRRLWARVAEVVGRARPRRHRVHAVTSTAMMTALRPVGERPALDRRLLRRRRRRRRRRHRAPPRPAARPGQRARPARRPQHAVDPRRRVAPRRGRRPRRRFVVRRALHRPARRSGVGLVAGDRGAPAGSAAPSTPASSPSASPPPRPPASATSTRAQGTTDRAQRVPERRRADAPGRARAGERRRSRTASLGRGLRGTAPARRPATSPSGQRPAVFLATIGQRRRVHAAGHVRRELLRGRRPGTCRTRRRRPGASPSVRVVRRHGRLHLLQRRRLRRPRRRRRHSAGGGRRRARSTSPARRRPASSARSTSASTSAPRSTELLDLLEVP